MHLFEVLKVFIKRTIEVILKRNYTDKSLTGCTSLVCIIYAVILIANTAEDTLNYKCVAITQAPCFIRNPTIALN